MFGRKQKKEKVDTKPAKKQKQRNAGQLQAPAQKLTSTGNILHSSGLILEKNDSILREFTMSSPDGDGWLVLTITSVYVVIKRKGVQLNLDWTLVNDFKINGNNLTIMWVEAYVNHYDYTIKITGNKIDEAANMFMTNEYLNEARYVEIPAEEREMIRRGRTEAQRNKVRKLEDEMADLHKKLDVLTDEFDITREKSDNVSAITSEKSEIKANMGMGKEINGNREPVTCHHYKDPSCDSKPSWSQTKSAYVSEGGAILKRIKKIASVMERERANLYFTAFDTIQRSPLIPAEVENKDVWYDTYYDAKHDAYVCVQDVWGARPEMKKLRKEMNLPFGCGFTPYPASMVDMIFGQPAAKFTYRSIQLLIPSWSGLSKIGIENYHYVRFMEGWPRLHVDDNCHILANSAWNGMRAKEYSRLTMRLGRSPGWMDPNPAPSYMELLEEEIQLAKEGNINYIPLVMGDTTYADSDDIGPVPRAAAVDCEIGFETFLFER